MQKHRYLSILSLALLLRCGTALKHNIGLGKTECFSTEVLAAHFDVVGGPRVEGAIFVKSRVNGRLPVVTATLHSPTGEQVWSNLHISDESHFNVAARGPGAYKICFYNSYDSHAEVQVDLVYFSLGHLRRPGQVQVPKGTAETRDKQMASKSHLDDVRRNVMVVSELVDILGGEQKYLRRKLDRHILTVHSNNRRTFWYTCLEVVVLLLVTAVNLAIVTGFFKGLPMRITV